MTEWYHVIGKFKTEAIILSTAYEEKALLGKTGRRFVTPEQIKLLKHFRLQQAIANHIAFLPLLQEEQLRQIADITGYKID